MFAGALPWTATPPWSSPPSFARTPTNEKRRSATQKNGLRITLGVLRDLIAVYIVKAPLSTFRSRAPLSPSLGAASYITITLELDNSGYQCTYDGALLYVQPTSLTYSRWLGICGVYVNSPLHNITNLLSCVHGPHNRFENKASQCFILNLNAGQPNTTHQMNNAMCEGENIKLVLQPVKI